MKQIDDFFMYTADSVLSEFHSGLKQTLVDSFYSRPHGDLSTWLKTLEKLPRITPGRFEPNQDIISMGHAEQLKESQKKDLTQVLQTFMPWRKGPWRFFGIEVDTEWRSNMKWDRINAAIDTLSAKAVLDIGCGNSYYGFRMLAHKPEIILGIDPTQLFLMQYSIIKRYLPALPIFQLPLKDEDLPACMQCFDIVFSMGVIYHRKDPLQHLALIRDSLKKGGDIVLESLILRDQPHDLLIPEDRYARMRNVWAIPGVEILKSWLQESGFSNVNIVDICQTTTAEQRVTPWMEFESLADFLDPDDPNLTIEGYPAPVRAIVTAHSG